MTTETLSDLFKRYDSIVQEIARIENEVTQLEVYPSIVMEDLTQLHLDKGRARRAINSAYIELERQKPLWKRIFKK